jgi:uncharacterized protein YdhG (YjbR/CyaY superfamily)
MATSTTSRQSQTRSACRDQRSALELDHALVSAGLQNDAVPNRAIDEYIAALDDPKRTTLTELRQTIHSIVPEAEECISYGMPAFRLEGKVIAGFAAFKDHLSYLPHSGSVLAELAGDLTGYQSTPGSLHFPVDQPLPKVLVKKLIAIRLKEVRRRTRQR